MGPSGLEPLASSLSGTRSNQLSYEPYSALSFSISQPRPIPRVHFSLAEPGRFSQRPAKFGVKKTTGDFRWLFKIKGPSVLRHAERFALISQVCRTNRTLYAPKCGRKTATRVTNLQHSNVASRRTLSTPVKRFRSPIFLPSKWASNIRIELPGSFRPKNLSAAHSPTPRGASHFPFRPL